MITIKLLLAIALALVAATTVGPVKFLLLGFATLLVAEAMIMRHRDKF